ncbi:hypothetical protein CBER1_07741 [Cercospora berteroae]|uniref:Uncharacterized protein n=1 Tax=Cercospora berteroae TaxID=357750 RepID=A0A2S6BSR6_9PEZI|nr:hypothetical protein CBER1_07741 [Cercospora berteroae]
MEVAGVVISAIPLCVHILDGCIIAGKHIAAFRRRQIKVVRYRRLLRTRKHDLEILLCDLLLGTVDLPLDPEKLYQLLQENWHDDQHAEMQSELAQKHGYLWTECQALLKDYYEELKHIVVKLGLASMGELGSIADLMRALNSNPLQRQGIKRLLTDLWAVLDREKIQKSMEGLGGRIDALRARLDHNADFQARKREAGKRSDDPSIRKHASLAMALILSPDELSQRRQVSTHTAQWQFVRLLESNRYYIALRDNISWQRTVFYVSDSEEKHQLDKSGAVPPLVGNLQPLISSSTGLVPCLEMHLDLTAQPSCLSGPYRTRVGQQYTLSDVEPEFKTVASLIGKKLDLERRIQLALTIASYIKTLFGTPFLESSCGKDDFGVLIRPNQEFDRAPVYLRRALFAQQIAASPASASPQMILLMLGIILLELGLDKDSNAYQTGSQPSLKDLEAHFDKWYEDLGTLPRKYGEAIRQCGMTGHASLALAEGAPQDLDEIVKLIETVCRALEQCLFFEFQFSIVQKMRCMDVLVVPLGPSPVQSSTVSSHLSGQVSRQKTPSHAAQLHHVDQRTSIVHLSHEPPA